MLAVKRFLPYRSTKSKKFINLNLLRRLVDFIYYYGYSVYFFDVVIIYSSFLHRLLVGAPTAASGRPESTNGGAVFSCSVNAEQCQRIEMDTEGIRRNKSGDAIETKSHQWFGSTLVSGGEDGHVLVSFTFLASKSKSRTMMFIEHCFLNKFSHH